MVGLIDIPAFDSVTLREQGTDAIAASAGDVLGAQFGSALAGNLTPRLVRFQERQAADTGIVGADDFGNPIQLEPEPQLDPAALNEKYGIAGHLNFDAPMSEFSARDLYDHKRAELLRQDIIERRNGGIATGGVARLGTGLVAGLLDPINLAAGLVPVLGEARAASVLGRGAIETLGAGERAAVRALAGGVSGGAIMTGLQPLEFGLSRSERNDYTMADALSNIAFGTVLGGGLHVVGGAIGDRVTGRYANPITERIEQAGPEAREGLLQGAIAQHIDGEPVNVAPALDAAGAVAEGRPVDVTSAAVTAPAELPPVIETAGPETLDQVRAQIDALQGGRRGAGVPAGAREPVPAATPAATAEQAAPAPPGAAAAPVLPPGMTRLYRGTNPTQQAGASMGWFTTDLEKAARYGDVQYVDVSRDELKHFAQGHGGTDEFVTDNAAIRARARPLSPEPVTQQPVTPRPIGGPVPNNVQSFRPGELVVDAKRFQFKEGGDQEGVTQRLQGVERWDPIKAGMAVVYEDADGTRYIVDGHQRLGLARRIAETDPAQDPRLNAYVLRAADGVSERDARVAAAAKNIAEGTGSAVDAAKVLRERPDLIKELPPRSELVRQARGLANLDDEAFGMVINDVVPANYAAIVGRLAPDDARMQRALLELLHKTEPENAVQAEAIVRQGMQAGTSTTTQAELFGTREIASSLYLDRAKILDRAIKQLRRDRRVFDTLVSERDLAEQLGNVLAHDENTRRAATDAHAIQIIQTLASRKGPVSDALSDAARNASDTGNYVAATRDFVTALRRQAASGDLSRLTDGGRGSALADRGADAAIPREPAAEPAARVAPPAAETQAAAQAKEIIEKTAQGDQRVMPGMEQSARQAQAAREAEGGGLLRPQAEQQEPGGLFAAPETQQPGLFDLRAADAEIDAAEGRAQAYERAAKCITGLG